MLVRAFHSLFRKLLFVDINANKMYKNVLSCKIVLKTLHYENIKFYKAFSFIPFSGSNAQKSKLILNYFPRYTSIPVY